MPTGYAPFNIWNLGGKLYVMWAKQNTAKTGWVNGAGLGAVSIFDLNGNLLQHVATGGPLNAPWGVAIAPATFGAFANDILVGNFGDGTINAFDPTSFNALGALTDQNGNTITLSGPVGTDPGQRRQRRRRQRDLLLGRHRAIRNTACWAAFRRRPCITRVPWCNAADTVSGIASNTFISIYGANLAPAHAELDGDRFLRHGAAQVAGRRECHGE